jgi:citrate lyase subunit beta/citryl-CoA lyase
MRTMLFCPASQPKMFLNAPVFHPDAILFDLEDAVAFAEKDSARDLLCSAMEQLDFGKSLVFVRINALKTPFGEADVRAVVPAGATCALPCANRRRMCNVWRSFWMKWRRSTRSPTAA